MQKPLYRTQVRMPQALGRRLKERATTWQTSTNRIMVTAIENFLGNTSPSTEIQEVLQVKPPMNEESNHEL
ncbi:hypothetical protein [Cardiobacterium sp. Marseille-Q4385]|jgi:hypothetical protein|uniref:hypothetical protein n=1 Tax=Cardiobacterium sp. Marseille-Q4385 TaxID=2866573 RepID=UPI001CE44E3A|nr:hypothetical protein [Cardiobacterium sp. Marseille-Q4385]DAW71836.1 MAG TPA: repressor [Caudoviricetes sp.]